MKKLFAINIFILLNSIIFINLNAVTFDEISVSFDITLHTHNTRITTIDDRVHFQNKTKDFQKKVTPLKEKYSSELKDRVAAASEILPSSTKIISSQNKTYLKKVIIDGVRHWDVITNHATQVDDNTYFPNINNLRDKLNSVHNNMTSEIWQLIYKNYEINYRDDELIFSTNCSIMLNKNNE